MDEKEMEFLSAQVNKFADSCRLLVKAGADCVAALRETEDAFRTVFVQGRLTGKLEIRQALMERIADEALNLNVRITKCLYEVFGHRPTVEELLTKSGDDLQSAKNFGAGSLWRLEDALDKFGLALRGGRRIRKE